MLPFLYSKKQFQDHVNEIMKILKDQALEKSEKYLEDLMQIKSQWARSCYNNTFDAQYLHDIKGGELECSD